MSFEIGYWGLFFACFLAATVIPFSSEVILSSMLLAGFNPYYSLIVATLGNWLGGMSSFGIGWLGKMEWIHKYLRIPEGKIAKAHRYVEGRVAWISLLCWVPFVGDVIAVVLGLLRANVYVISVGMLIGKAVRYVVWMYLTMKTIELF
jgi:membrane protein YqaA with SNARE-associated domain